MLTNLNWLAKGTPFPLEDEDEKKRLAEHAKNRKLYNDIHSEIFPKYQAYLSDKQFDDKKIEIILGWAETATTNYMDLLLGEGVDIEAPIEYDTPDEEVFIDDSRYGIGLYEISEDGIGVLSPENVYMVADPANIRRVIAYVAFNEFNIGDKKFVKFTIHEAGSIQHLVYSINNAKLDESLPLAIFPDYAGLKVDAEGRQPTGIDELLIVRVDNALSSERYYGRSDYTPTVHSLIEALELAFARRAEVLAKFSRPVPMVPESAMRFDHSKQKWVFKTENAIIMEEGSQSAAYLTWSADLGSVEREIEQTMTQLLVKLKLSKVLLAGENEGQAESGTALRIRLIPTLSKVRKFATSLKATVPIVYSLKSKLDAALGLASVAAFEPDKVTVELKDGIPEDPMESAQIALTKSQVIGALKAQGVIDTATAIRASLLSGLLTPEMLSPLEDAEMEAKVTGAANEANAQGVSL